MPSKPKGFQHFTQGIVPTIACFNHATTPLGVDFSKLIAALQKYIDHYVAPVWGTPAKLIKTRDFRPGAWALVFLDNPDQKGALAYHQLTPDGLPTSKVFVKEALKFKTPVSLSASHELVEMLVDPGLNIYTTGPNKKVTYAYESADPVEESFFLVDKMEMSDFVYPAYFETFRKRGSAQFDYMNLISKPFQILKGGYQIHRRGSQDVTKFGSKAKALRFKKEDRRGHRSAARSLETLRVADTATLKKYFR